MYCRSRAVLAALSLVCLFIPSTLAGRASADETYQGYEAFTETLRGLQGEHDSFCELTSIGQSLEGRALWAVRIAAPGAVEPDARPGLLLVGGLDGHHLVGSHTAVGVIEGMLTRVAEGDQDVTKLLTNYVVYAVPRANPDGMERAFMDNAQLEYARNARTVDTDRDARMDEDGPDDLNGDGLITQMRVYDPDKADMMADPINPRLNATPDRSKGQRATFYLMTEGLDNDGDGQYNEDPPGGVDLNRNFMHGYVEHQEGAGRHQLSEPESLALLQYAIAHQNIAAVIVYGRHDTLINVPDSRETYPPGTPKGLDAGDTDLYQAVGELYRGITDRQHAPKESWAGSFVAWAYAQYGVPAFATAVWQRPDPKPRDDAAASQQDDAAQETEEGEQPSDHPSDDETLTPSGFGDISQETIDELLLSAERAGFTVTDEMKASMTTSDIEQYARQAGITIRRVKAGAAGEVQDKEDAAWLAYSDDQRDGQGYIGWTRYEHPQLGDVEIGGWVPGFRTNPPASEVAALAEKQCEFALELLGKFPQVSLTDVEVIPLGPGLFEVKAALVNDGWLPAGTAMASRNRRARPYVVRLSTPYENIVTGQRMVRVWSLPGSGGRESFRWILSAPDNSELTITVYSAKYGQFDHTVTLAPSN